MSGTAVAVSAPGKVLFTGGFLVLDRAHTGLVFGLDARIHVHIEPWSHNAVPEQSVVAGEQLILVSSPQFKDASWLYRVDPTKPAQDEAISLSQVTDNESFTTSGNKFVQTTLQYTLTYLLRTPKHIDHPVKLTIMADNDYYSKSVAASETKRYGFTDFGVTLSNAHKTGLGSSAALVTSLVGALLTYYSNSSELPKQTIHNLAQAAHCAAQGKVGSGFDVAAAVFGSCLYRRFTPAILESVGEPASARFGERLHLCVEDLSLEHKWDVQISSQAVRIPNSLHLLMCDVDCGSETPGMVRKVLQWRKEKPTEASWLWTAIQKGSDDLCQELRRLSELEGLSMDNQEELCDIIATIRSLVKEMSQLSGVPIEPDVITELLDYCTDIPGVVGGVAPGAGGYDAVALLVRNHSPTLLDLSSRLEVWTAKEEDTGATIGKVRLLDVRQAHEGMRQEIPNRYGDWIK